MGGGSGRGQHYRAVEAVGVVESFLRLQQRREAGLGRAPVRRLVLGRIHAAFPAGTKPQQRAAKVSRL